MSPATLYFCVIIHIVELNLSKEQFIMYKLEYIFVIFYDRNILNNFFVADRN